MNTERHSDLARRFQQALQQCEQSRSPEELAKLFATDATLHNLGANESRDARVFWQTYLEQFQQIRSEFTHEVIAENSAALEWRSRGTLRDGAPIEYRGVSLLELDNDTIRAFRTYYDSAAFVAKG